MQQAEVERVELEAIERALQLVLEELGVNAMPEVLRVLDDLR